MLLFGCIGAFIAGLFINIPSLPIAIMAGAGGILTVIYLFFPHYDWTLAMKIAFPICGALGAALRVLWNKSSASKE